MPVTTLHKLIGLSVALLGQAPGTDLLNEWTRLYTQSREDGLNAMAALQKVAQHILNSDAFAEVHPAYLIIDNQDFAQRFLNQVLGETASAEVVTLVVGLLNSGTSRAEVAVRAVEYLLEVNHQGTDHTDHGTFGTYAMRFGNQVEVARYYTVDKKWMTPGESVLNEVDDTAASVAAAKGRIDGMQQPGKNFTLTTNVDQFTGTPGDDMFVATESTLNGADRLDGKEGMDTLELSSGSGANDDISIPIGATVKGIETLSVNSDGKFTGDVSKWEGLKTVQLEVVENVDLELKAGDGTKVTSASLGDDDKASTVTIENAGMVALEGVSKQATVKITGEGTESVMVEGGKSVHVNTKASPSTTVNNVTVDGVARNNGEDGKRDGTTGAGTEDKNKDKASVEVYSKALANIALHNTDAIVLVQNDATDMTELTAMVNKFGLSASMMGKLCLQGIEDLMLQVAGASYFDLASNEIKSINVSGTGDLTLDVNKFDNSKASTTLESLMLSGSGKFTMDADKLSKLKMVDASEASGDVAIKNLGNSVTEYTGSAGKDTVTVAAFNSKGLMANLGAGDDMFTVKNISAGKSKINGGEGMDTLVLKQTDGAKVKGAGDAYTGFETITLDAGGGKGDYDLKGLDIDELLISSSSADGDDTDTDTDPGDGVIAFKNVMVQNSASSLVVSAAAGKKTVAKMKYTLSDEAKASSVLGTELHLKLHATGHKDDTKDSGGGTNYIGGAISDVPRTAATGNNRGADIDGIIVDDHIRAMTIDASVTLGASTLKATDYGHVVLIGGTATGEWNGSPTTDASNVERLTIIGNASVLVSSVGDGLNNLRYVDATGATGNIEIEGFDVEHDIKMVAGDVGMYNFGGGAGGDTLTGGKSRDVLLGRGGNNKLTGGGGGDILHGGTTGTGKGTFIYNAASDSQVRFDGNGDPASGFDTILPDDPGGVIRSPFGSTGGSDVIDLGNVVSLQGQIQKHLTATVGNKGLSQYLKDNDNGDGLFETDVTNSLSKNKHSIVVVETKEADKSINSNLQGSFANPDAVTEGSKDDVTWILVDVDSNGDFDASVDMAIAAISHVASTITADNFMG